MATKPRLLILTALVASLSGCAGLRSKRQTRELSTARQYSLRGAEALQQNRWNDAEALFLEAMRHSPADDRAQWGIAEVLWEQGKHAKATDHMRRAAEISGGNPDILVRLGEMHLEQGSLKAAAEQADLALESQRKHAAAWALKGNVLRQQAKLQEALDCYHRALIYRADNPQVQISLAQLYRLLDRPQRALHTLDLLADQQTDGSLPGEAWLLKGQALADLGESNASVECYRQAALCCNEDDAEILLQLARAHYEGGDLAEARFCLGRVLRCSPENQQALAFQSQLEQQLGTLENSVASPPNARTPALTAGFHSSAPPIP